MAPVVTAGTRFRRLVRLCSWRGPAEGISDWRAADISELADAVLAEDLNLGTRTQVGRLIHELAADRDEIPPLLRPALCRVLQIPDTYFDDQVVADQEDVRRIWVSLRALGVTHACLCRCPPMAETRIDLWTVLLDVARQHALTDHQVAECGRS